MFLLPQIQVLKRPAEQLERGNLPGHPPDVNLVIEMMVTVMMTMADMVVKSMMMGISCGPKKNPCNNFHGIQEDQIDPLKG